MYWNSHFDGLSETRDYSEVNQFEYLAEGYPPSVFLSATKDLNHRTSKYELGAVNVLEVPLRRAQ